MTERQHELIRRRLEGKTVALHTDAFEEETEAIRVLVAERDQLLVAQRDELLRLCKDALEVAERRTFGGACCGVPKL